MKLSILIIFFLFVSCSKFQPAAHDDSGSYTGGLSADGRRYTTYSAPDVLLDHKDDINSATSENPFPINSQELREIRIHLLKDDEKWSPQIRGYLKQMVLNGGHAQVRSHEVFPGASTLEIAFLDSNNATMLTADGDLLETDGECARFDINGLFKESTQSCLLGNDHHGHLVIFVMHSDGQHYSFWVEIQKRPAQIHEGVTKIFIPSTSGLYLSSAAPQPVTLTSAASKASVSTPAHPLTPAALNPAEYHAVLAQLLSDLDRDEVKKLMKDYQTDSRMKRYLKLYRDSKIKNAPRDATDFGQVIKVISQFLHSKNISYPEAISWVTMVESGFDKNAKSGAGAAGLWQLTKDTATARGCKVYPKDERLDPFKSTVCAMRQFEWLRRYYPWSEDIHLRLAAYNWGQGCLSQMVLTGQITSASCKKGVNTGVPVEDVLSYSKNFWDLYELKMMPAETRSYVLENISGFLFSVDPSYTKPMGYEALPKN